ncbi:MAG: PaaI family thioesterase [Lachnospiraceae bacterium]|nr:PaaI family thioesterase [Lachnospiraceae bacterium]
MEDKKFNVLNPDEYLANNPFMQHNHMYITEIGTECSEIRMEVHPDGLNIMGQVHGGLLYSLADVVTGLTARADGRKYVTQSAHVNFIGNVSEGTIIAKGVLVRRGRSITIVRGIVTDANGKLLLETTVDMFCLNK